MGRQSDVTTPIAHPGGAVSGTVTRDRLPGPLATITAIDACVAVAFAVAAAVSAWTIYDYFRPLDIGAEQWFQADLGRNWVVLTDRYSPYHERSRIHPLFSLINTTLVYGLRAAGLNRWQSVQLWGAIGAGALAALTYGTARLLRFARFDASMATALVLASSSMLFWASVPETKVVGAISILLCVTVAAIHERRPMPDAVLVAAAAISLSMTITNFMAGLALLVMTRPPRRAVQLAVNAFCVVSILQIVQNFVYFYTTGMASAFRSETRFMFDHSSGTPVNKAIVGLFHSMVMPAVLTPSEFDTKTPMLSIQAAMPGASGVLAAAAVIAWTVALAWGCQRIWKTRGEGVALKVCVLTAIGQLLLHVVYGDSTFLHTLHFLPLLVLIAVHVTRQGRPFAGRALLVGLLALCVWNNVEQVRFARTTLDRIVPLGKADPALSGVVQP